MRWKASDIEVPIVVANERILDLFGRIAEANADELIVNKNVRNSMDKGDLIQSQDFTTIYQSQTRNTLKVTFYVSPVSNYDLFPSVYRQLHAD